MRLKILFQDKVIPLTVYLHFIYRPMYENICQPQLQTSQRHLLKWTTAIALQNNWGRNFIVEIQHRLIQIAVGISRTTVDYLQNIFSTGKLILADTFHAVTEIALNGVCRLHKVSFLTKTRFETGYHFPC